MKFITRTITIYSHKFAKVDIARGAVEVTDTIELPYKLTHKQINEYSKEHDGVIFVGCDESEEKYSLPITEFIDVCKQYYITNGGCDTDNN